MNDDLEMRVPADEPFIQNGSSADTSAGDLAAANAKAAENYNKFLLAMADFENYKKRVERQLGEISLAGKKSVLKKFLPVLDNLERALTYDPGSEGLRGGLAATLRGFESVLESEGVKAMPLKGARFDPKFAEAIGTRSASDVPEETVLEEAARAYVMGDDVLRVGQVIVAKSE
ncbi:MAG TPA: nucleotide exchange factor GrpE [Candidatus Lustribacter sp.]